MKTPGGVYVPFPPDLTPVHVIRRRNRFTVEAELAKATDGGRKRGDTRAVVPLHLPNSGRMTELLQPGTLGLAQMVTDSDEAMVGGGSGSYRSAGAAGATDGGGSRAHRSGGAPRRTAGTLLLVKYAGRWVSVDARMPNRLFARCLEEDALPPFRGYPNRRAEVGWGRSRMDFLLAASGRPSCLVETKSCNLVEKGLALFPDAPTTRGARHLLELAEAVKTGWRAAVVWFVQRDDASALAPHQEADPDFARALAHARATGVEAYAYRCQVDPGGVRVLGAIPVIENP